MAVTTTTYSTDRSIATTQWGTNLASTEFATSAIFDNTSDNFNDLLVGGEIAAATATGTLAVGDTFDIYIGALYDKDTTTTAGGGIGTSLDPGTPAEEVADTGFVLANLILFKSVAVKSATPDGTYDLVFNPQGCAQFFGGVLPQKIYFMLHNNSGATLGAGSLLNAVGITYTTT